MNKKKIRQALKLVEYFNSIGKLGAQGVYRDKSDKRCILGCLFDDSLLSKLKKNAEDSSDISFLYRKYPRLENHLGMTMGEAQRMQDLNDFCSSLEALDVLRRWAK